MMTMTTNNNVTLMLNDPQDIYIAIKVKRLNYLGHQSVILFIRDVSKKVRSVIERV